MRKDLLVVIAIVTLSATEAAAMCFDLALESARYTPEQPVCARDDGALFHAVPACAPIEAAVVEGCLGFEPQRGLLDEKVERRGRAIVRQLVARDACSSGWELSYTLDAEGHLRAEATPLNRCQHVALTSTGGTRALEPTEPLQASPITLFRQGKNPHRGVSRAAQQRLLLDQSRPEQCAALAAGLFATEPIPRELLAGARHVCLAETAERGLEIPSLQADAERALLRIHERSPGELRGALLRAVGRGQPLLAVARALRPALDEHRVLKGALFGHTAGPALQAASLVALELLGEDAARLLTERVEGLKCEDAAWTLRLDEVKAALTREAQVGRRFTPLLDPRKACEPTRVEAVISLTRRLAEGRSAQPAAWRLLMETMETDPSPTVRQAAAREARLRFSCGARADDLVMPAFALDQLLRRGVRVPCAKLPPAALAAAPPAATADPDDVPAPIELPPVGDPPPSALPLPPSTNELREPYEPPKIKPRGREESRLGAFGLARLYGDGGVAGIGVQGMWLIDDGFGFTAGGSLGFMCSGCFTSGQIHRRDLRFDLGMVFMPFPEAEFTPYIRGAITMGDAEIASSARTAAAFLIGIDGGLGLEWLLSDDFSLFFEGTGFLMGEAEQSFGAGIPSAPGIAQLGREHVGGQLRVGLAFRL